MTTISHNSSEDVTSLTDEQALWAACVRVCEARFSYTSEDCLVRTFWPVLIGMRMIFVSVCALLYTCQVSKLALKKVKVKSNRIINDASFYIMLNQTLELLPLEDQLSNLI